jgi:hypothetical protein
VLATASNFWPDAGIGATIILAIASIFGKPILTWRDGRRDQRKADHDMDLWMHGRPEIPGVAPALIPAPLEMMKMKADVATLTADMAEVKPAVVGVQSDVVDIRSALAAVTTTADEALQVVKKIDFKITKNGENSDNIGDMVARTARAAGVMPNPAESHGKPEEES